jgi:hypothetical protein
MIRKYKKIILNKKKENFQNLANSRLERNAGPGLIIMVSNWVGQNLIFLK